MNDLRATGRRSGRMGDGASSALLGFLGGMVIYAVAFVVYVNYAATPVTESSTVDVDLDNRAGAALDLLIRDSGDWTADPDTMRRFGLATSDANFLDFDKVKLLRKGKITASANDYPDYPEAKSALALDGYQFHVRSYPVLVGIDDPGWSKMRGVRAAYVADYDEPTTGAVTAPSVVDVGGGVKAFRVTVTHDAALPMVYVVSFSFDVDGKTQTTTRQTRMLTFDGDQDVAEIRIHPMQDWDQATVTMTARTSSHYGTCTTGCAVQEPSGAVTESGAYRIHLLAEASAAWYLQGDTVRFHVDHFDKDGGKRNGEQARLRVYRPTAPDALTQEASPMLDVTGALPHQNNQRWSPQCACADRSGLWKVVVTPPSDNARDTTFHYWVAASEPFGPTAPTTVALNEQGTIDELVESFDAAIYTVAGGDVFPDETSGMRALEDVLDNNPPACDADPDYDMLIVGSNVAHNALVKIKDEAADFVDCGGTLVALGSSLAGTEWLQPIYHVALRNAAGGGISSPDPTHPLLSVPERLSWNRYRATGYEWEIDPGEDIWSHAVDGSQPGTMMLGVSEQGALAGTVVLTGWTPGELTTPHDPHESKKFLHNLMSQSYQMLYIDYGPEIPGGVPVASSSRLAAVQYADLPDAPYVEVKMVLYVWRG